MHQRVDQCTTLLLNGNCNGSAAEAITQRLNPSLEGFRRMVQCEALPAITAGFLQCDDMFLICPIQTDKRGDFDMLFRHQFIHFHRSPCTKPLRQRVAHNPYSRVLEGHHLSICPTARADRARKSLLTVDAVRVAIRNATRPVFHKENSSKKRKKNQKRKTKRPVENVAAMEIRQRIGRLRPPFLDADSHSCLEKPR